MSWFDPPEVADFTKRERYEHIKKEYEALREVRRAKEAEFLELRKERDALHWENVDIAKEIGETDGSTISKYIFDNSSIEIFQFVFISSFNFPRNVNSSDSVAT